MYICTSFLKISRVGNGKQPNNRKILSSTRPNVSCYQTFTTLFTEGDDSEIQTPAAVLCVSRREFCVQLQQYRENAAVELKPVTQVGIARKQRN